MTELSCKKAGMPNRAKKTGPTICIKIEKEKSVEYETWPLEKRINNAASRVPNPMIEMGSNSTIMITGSSSTKDERLMGKPKAKAQQ